MDKRDDYTKKIVDLHEAAARCKMRGAYAMMAVWLEKADALQRMRDNLPR